MAKSAFTMPARGSFPSVELAKKAPKKADALLIAAFSGEDGLEVPGSDALDSAALRATYEALAAVDATGRAGEITRIPAPQDSIAPLIVAVGLGDAELLDAERCCAVTPAPPRVRSPALAPWSPPLRTLA